jgi:type IV pilus assembly protein PilM
MLSTSKQKSIVGLDLEAGSLAAAEVGADGARRVSQVAIAPLGGGLIKEGEVVDPDALSAALRSLFAEHKLSKSVRLGVANQRVAVRTMRLPLIEDPEELATAVRFQAQEHLPMPIDQAVLDHRVVARFQNEDGTRGMDVVAVAARRDMLRTLISAVRGAGLRPVGIDLSAFALIRALAREAGASQQQGNGVAPEANGNGASPEANGGADAETVEQPAEASEGGPAAEPHVPTVLYCNLGDVTNLAVARGSTCLFTRISPFGVESVAQKLAERRTLTLEHARQWLVHVGLERPAFEIEGDQEIVTTSREVLEEGSAKLADELRLSLEFYGAQEGAPPVERIVVAGPGSTIPGLIDRLQGGIGNQPFSTARPTALAELGDGPAARLTISYGLALEE